VKKPIITILCLFMILFVSACTIVLKKDSTEDTTNPAVETTDDTTAPPASDSLTVATSEEETTGALTEATLSPTATPTEEVTTTTAKVTPVNTATMYSSYAYLVSYDPANGWAEFDYFDMLKGDTAVQWLVDNEDYSLADAQALVDDFADSEFVLKNINPQLRTVDLSVTPLKLMYYADGTMVSGPDPVDTSYAEMNTFYGLYPDLILDSFFFHVTVSSGIVVFVEQVYWP